MYKKVIGSILMILGTSVGAGMLALPVVTANESFAISIVLLFASWFFMTIGAFSLLEVNLWLAPTTNMITMADKTLGKWGKLFTWLFYLLLLYSLICAYLSGLSDILQNLLADVSIHISRPSATIFGLCLFGVIVYRGIGSVDIVNRGLMSVKLIAYVLLVLLIAPNVSVDHIFEGDYQWRNSAFMVMLTSFGYAIIVPSLRYYLDSDQKIIKKVIIVGSLIPLLVYAIWISVIQGVIPRIGDLGLINMITSENTNSMLMNAISTLINSSWSANITKIFISICAVTSFLGVSICLTDFIADGLSIKKTGKSAILVYMISYLPPLLIVLVSPGLFVTALDYAGIWCLVLLVIIPLMMLYSGRYKLKINKEQFLPLGKRFILATLIIAIVILIYNIKLLFY